MNNKELFNKFFENKNDGIWQYRNEIYCHADRASQIKIVKKFSDIIEGPITISFFDWAEADRDEETQNKIFDALNKGIVIFKNIPTIPGKFDDFKKEYFGFDTEDNGYAFPHYYQFSWKDGIAFSMSFRLLIRWATQTFQMSKFNHLVWGTNIEYELGNIIKDFDVSNETVELRWRRGTTTKIAYRYSPKLSKWGPDTDKMGWIVMWDTMNHWKLSVEKQGKALSQILSSDFSKLDKDFYSFKYAAMDAIISRSYACIQRLEYEQRRIPLKLTPGATALAWFTKGETKNREKFCEHKLYKTHTEEELDWMMPSLRGGRTEVFSLKEYEGKIGYFDINSAYPFSMKFGVFPDISKHHWIKGHDKILDSIEKNYEGIVDCDVDASNVDPLCSVIPYLGTREQTTGRFIFPLGKWKDKYTIFEIREAMDHGYKFKFHKAIIYKRLKESPFVRYIDAAYGLRLEGAATGNNILKDIGKSLGNNLFGKFGQRTVFTKLDDPDNYSSEQLENMKRIGDAVIVEEDGGYAPQTNVVWGAYITAMTRSLLFKHIKNAIMAGNEIIYCDTDSIFISSGDWPESHPTDLGALKHEGDLTYFKAILPKTYIYEMEGKKNYKAKGVPSDQRERFLMAGRVEYRKPLKLRESLVRKTFNAIDQKKGLKPGMMAANAWITVTKELKGEYTKRKVLPSLDTLPHFIKQ
jgi:hypothetical protein